jgi:hypothetical protein
MESIFVEVTDKRKMEIRDACLQSLALLDSMNNDTKIKNYLTMLFSVIQELTELKELPDTK